MEKLRFIGNDPFVKNGKVYNIDILGFYGKKGIVVSISRFGIYKYSYCPYETLESFWANWEEVSDEL